MVVYNITINYLIVMDLVKFVNKALDTNNINFNTRSEHDGNDGDEWHIREIKIKIDPNITICYKNLSNECDFDFDEISFCFADDYNMKTLTWISEGDDLENDAVISEVSQMLGIPVIREDMVELSIIMKKKLPR